MEYFLTGLLLLFLCISPSNSDTEKDDHMVLFSTKTSYAGSFGGVEEITKTFQNTKSLLESRQPFCRPLQVNALFRHGTRYPSRSDLNVLRNLEDLQEHLQNEKYLKLKSWKSKFSNVEPKMLAESGRWEMRSLGERFAQYFPELMKKTQMASGRIKFISSDTPRTKDSAEMFMEGLQSMMGSDEDDVDLEILNRDSDILLRFFDTCEKFVQTVEENKTALIEVSKFGDSSEVQAVVEAIQQRLNISDNTKLYKDHAKAVFSICASESAILGHSNWCNVMTTEDVQVIEYWMDLKHYWKKGYGYELNYHISCRLLQDIFVSMDQAVSKGKGDDYTVGTFWFGHAETVFPLIAALGLFNDTVKLTADNFATSKNRLFRGAMISPFAANVALILYKCDKDGSDDTDIMLEILLQETPITLPCCASTLCSYSTVKSCYSKWLNNCNFEKLCEFKNDTVKVNDEL